MTEITDEQIAAWEAQDDYDYQLVSRIDKLEQLCRDMYHVIWGEDTSTKTCEMLRQRMEQLGLLDGEQK